MKRRKNKYKAERLCANCLTTDASFPLIPGCPMCAQALTQEENAFWNEPSSVEVNDGWPQDPVEEAQYLRAVLRTTVHRWGAFWQLIMFH